MDSKFQRNASYKKEFHPEFFRNTLKLETRNGACRRSEIVEGLKKIVDIKNIDCLGQYKGKNNWSITFKSDYDYNLLSGKSIHVKDCSYMLEPIIKKNQKKCFKVVWLPTSFTKIDEVAKKLCSNVGKTISIKKVIDQDGITMNIYNITIEFPENHSIDFRNLTGKKELYGEQMFITCYGDPIRCIYCSEFGHKKAECVKFNSICADCGKRGHSKCTMATKLNKNSNEDEIDYEEDDEEGKKEENVLSTKDNTNYSPNHLLPTISSTQEILKAVTSKINNESKAYTPLTNIIEKEKKIKKMKQRLTSLMKILKQKPLETQKINKNRKIKKKKKNLKQ